MSLSQASSPEEAKRELKQQVFLAIQGKYDTRQTSQLIEDIDTITSAIAGSLGVPQSSLGKSDKPTSAAEISKAIMDQSYNGKAADFIVPKAAILKEHIFIGGRHDGVTRSLSVNTSFKPHKESIGLIIPSGNIPNGSNSRAEGITTVYHRQFLTVVTGGWSVTRWFYCDEKDISDWTEQKLLSTLDRINKFFVDNMEDSMNT